jgi:hypothetical protein
VHAAGPALRVDPGTQTVGLNSDVAVKIVQSADFATIGAQASISFDPSILQIEAVEAGQLYADASFVIGVSDADNGIQQDATAAIDESNTTGMLQNVAVYFVPGSGSVPAGDADFLILTMRSVREGTSQIQLTGPIQMGDEEANCYGCPTDINPLASKGPVGATAGQVVVSSSAPASTPPASTAAPGTSPTVAATSRPASTVQSTVLSAASTPPAGDIRGASDIKGATVLVSPASQKVAKSDTFTVDVKQRVDQPLTGAQAKITFKKDLVEITRIDAGSEWRGASGASSKALSDAATSANDSGIIELAYSSSSTVPAGEITIATVTMRARDKDGTSPIKLTDLDLVDASGKSISLESKNGEVTVGSGDSSSMMMYWMIGAVSLGVVAAGGGGAYYLRRRNGR